MGDSMNPFAVLGVDETATAEEITAAYRARAKVLHPDGLFEGRDDDRAAAEAAMAELNLAHQLLTDDATRTQYRRTQKQRRAAAARRGEEVPSPPARDVHFSGTYRAAAPAEFTVEDRTVGTPWVATRRSRVLRRPR